MAIMLKNRYLFNLTERIGGFMDIKGKYKKVPKINFMSEGEYQSYYVDICGEREKFYIKKGTLKRSELQAIYVESFQNHILNGHCYVRTEINVNKGDVVVDAGGCEGYYAKFALNKGADKVIIFEPCADLAAGLKKTFENDIRAGKVLIVEKALGRRRSKDILYINQDMFCSSCIVKDEKHTIKQELTTISLDEALEDIGINHIDVLKMDIEDAEVNAVIGARKTIGLCHPKMIIATYHSYFNAMRIVRICKKIDANYKYKLFGCYQFKKPYRPYLTFLSY